jgi:long-subunit acyl-CoA synthetase (AMP-forming)
VSEFETILDCAYRWEKEAPDRIYFTQPLGGGDANLKTWTFRQAVQEARRMATYLKGLGLPPKSQIALCSKNCAHWIMADLAIWMAGHVSVPLFPNLTPDTIRFILEHSESKLLFVGKLDPVWEEMKQGIPSDLPQIAFPLAPPNDLTQWDAIIANNEPLQEPERRSPDELATLIYTSGSTGQPKGVMINFGPMLTCAEGATQGFDTTPEDRMISYLPLAHVMERWVVECHSLHAGFPLWFAESIDSFVQDVQRARPTLFVSVPRLWQKFQSGVFEKLPPEKLNRLLRIPLLNRLIKKKILKGLGLDATTFAGTGSAPIPNPLIQWFRDLGLDLGEGYGMTENFSYSHIPRKGQYRTGTVGQTCPGVECRISEEGEIQIGSPGMMTGYFKRPDLTEETFTKDGFLRTGDLGSIDADGFLSITGRSKEIFKTSKGEYVSPAPIEKLVGNHPHIEACYVDGASFPQPLAVLTLADAAVETVREGGREKIENELVVHLEKVNSELVACQKLQLFCVVKESWLPENDFLTPTMKIKRPTLPARLNLGSVTSGVTASKITSTGMPQRRSCGSTSTILLTMRGPSSNSIRVTA